MKIYKNLLGDNSKIKYDTIAGNGNTMNDFVIEQRDTYRKWNSGVIEMFWEGGTTLPTGVGAFELHYPTPVVLTSYNTTTQVFHNLRTSTTSAHKIKISRSWLAANNKVQVSIEKEATTGGTIYMKFYVVGTWK